jgi:hypothetical protein
MDFSGISPEEDPLCAYYSFQPHSGVRVIVLDWYVNIHISSFIHILAAVIVMILVY